jgi:lipopolysaccharide export system permease protein
MGKILHRYVFREVLTPFLLGISIFTVVLLITRLLKLIELVVSRGLPPGQILRLIGYLMPAFLEITVPMAMLLAILIAFGRLSADSELVAMRSSGLSLYQIVPPIALFVGLTTIATGALSMYVRPRANASLKQALWEIARTRATAGLKPQVFNDEFPGLVIYTEQIDSRTDRLVHVLISDERDPQQRNTVFAREGYMISDSASQTVTLRLYDGTVHSSGDAASDYQTNFETYDVNLDLRENLGGSSAKEPNPSELTFPALLDLMRHQRESGAVSSVALVELHRRFAIPFACIVFGLVGIPLGIAPARAVRSRGFAISLAVIFTYYILLSAGQGLAEQGSVPAWFGLWAPNMIFGTLGALLLHEAGRERTLARSVGDFFTRMAWWPRARAGTGGR